MVNITKPASPAHKQQYIIIHMALCCLKLEWRAYILKSLDFQVHFSRLILMNSCFIVQPNIQNLWCYISWNPWMKKPTKNIDIWKSTQPQNIGGNNAVFLHADVVGEHINSSLVSLNFCARNRSNEPVYCWLLEVMNELLPSIPQSLSSFS